jgi:DNA-binding CsgD family transcriptional regulator
LNRIKQVQLRDKDILLTEKQYAVYDLKLKGFSHRAISNKLNISINAIEKRIHNIIEKAGYNLFKSLHDTVTNHVPFTIDEDVSTNDFLIESNRHLKAQLRKYKKETAIEEQIFHLFETTLKRYPNHKSFPIISKDNHKSDEELVIMLSDIHAGEIVKKKGTIGLNEYDMEVMEQRMQNIFNNATSIIQDANCNFKKLHVFLLGDFCSGIIHSELKEGVSMVDQVYVTASIIAEMIYKWSKMFPQVEVSCVVGNHGRLQKEIQFKNKHDNFDSFIYHAIKIHLKNVENIHIDIPECPWLVKEIEGKKFLLTHGDSRVPGYNGISYYKIDKMDNNASKTLSNMLDIKIDYICIAHYHVPATLGRIGGGKILVNGCVIGTGDFALFAMNVGTTPIQRMFRIHKKYGINHEDDIRVLD